MKNIVLAICCIVLSITLFAQQAKVITANRYLKDFGDTRDVESLNKAKEAIDLATVNEKTKDQAKTYVYRGQIYLTIYDNNLRIQTDKLGSIADPNKRALLAYQSTEITDLEEAYQAFLAGKKLDDKEIYKTEISSGLSRIGSHFENTAIADFNAKKYTVALPIFERAYDLTEGKDTLVINNCALVAEKANNYEKAKLYYQKLIDQNAGRGIAYSSLMNALYMLKDTTSAIETLKKGRAAFPNDIALLISETNYFLRTSNSNQALINLNQAIQVKTDDANLYLVRASTYDNIANPKDASGTDLPKPSDFEGNMQLAEADYKKALELKPDYFDALFNLGILYNNKGVELNKKADKITDPAQNKDANAKAAEQFNLAMPILERALQVNPQDRSTMFALKQIYSRLQLNDKLNAIKEKLKN